MHTSKSEHHIISDHPSDKRPGKNYTPQLKIDKTTLVLGIMGILLVSVGIAWVLNGRSFDFSRERSDSLEYSTINDQVIAKVGVEDIFAEDVTYEQGFYPEAQRAELAAGIKERLIEESIILQAGADAGIIQLSSEVFNTVHKDREKRRELVMEVENSINEAASHKKGAVVSIWFMNFAPGPIGYEQGQQVALEKITDIHSRVSSGQISIKQAGEIIKNDTSLAQLDSVYDNNAYFEFDTRNGQDITFEDTFNQELLSLGPGETSQVFTGQDYERDLFDQPKKDAMYMFGQVTEEEVDGPLPFDAWVEQQRSNYEVIEY